LTTTMRTTATKRVPMDSMRKTALVAGIFYLITFISIPTVALYGPVKNHRDWILGSGGHTAVLVGGFLEVIVALAGIGTAVTLYPVVKRQNEGVALGFVAARVLEAGMIFAGVVSLLSLVTLRQDFGGAAGADAAALVTTGASHAAVYNWTFLLGQSLMPGINALLLGSLMYRSRLVPRVIPVLGLIGAPPLIAAVFATLLGGSVPPPSVALLGALPVAAWELSLGVWLVVKGFRPSPITTGMTAAGPAPDPPTTTSPPNPRKHGPDPPRAGRCPRRVRTAAHTKSPSCPLRCCSALANRGTQITAICAYRGADDRSTRAANSWRSVATQARGRITLGH
jgi:hypothetical protein